MSNETITEQPAVSVPGMASHPDIPEQVPFVERTTVGVAADVPEVQAASRALPRSRRR